MAKIGTIFTTWLFSKKIGQDQFGNRYYLSKDKNSQGDNKRTVIYKGTNEPSKVPPIWHSWLHYIVDEPPKDDSTYDWQKQYIPNLTGTKYAYKANYKKSIQKIKSSYQAWNPTNKFEQ